MDFTIFPAIDLRMGRVVRLRQGDPSMQTVYSDNPAEIASQWADMGASWLHVVNLDGAFGAGASPDQDGPALNLQRLAEIRSATDVRIQFGGGLRSLDDIQRAVDLGADRVVVGTAAVRRPAMIRDALHRFGAARIAVGLDARGQRLAVQGWQETSNQSPMQLAIELHATGVRTAIYTDIARDGMLTGVNLDATIELAKGSGIDVIASGGIRGIDDIRLLLDQGESGIVGVIAGQALYTGALDLKVALGMVQSETDRVMAAESRAACPKGES